VISKRFDYFIDVLAVVIGRKIKSLIQFVCVGAYARKKNGTAPFL